MMKLHKWNMALMVIIILSCNLVSCAKLNQRAKNPCKNPEYVKVLLEQVEDFYVRGDYRSALKASMEALQCEPDDGEIEYWLGLCYFKLEKYTDAIEHLKNAESLQQADTPEIAETQMALGIIYLELQRWDEAIQAFSAVTNNLFFPRSWEAFNNLGWSYYKNGQVDLAEEFLELALKHNGSFCLAHTNAGEVYSARNKAKPAIAHLKRSIEICPRYSRSYLLLGLEYNRQKSLGKACAQFSLAYQVNPESADGSKALEYIQLLNCPLPPVPTED